ncbi:MAG: hypothetical protein LLG40_13860 [Deltaproteobacteria bacterium]|nr:hypothetical protein [Deltaproteobacteria bacterium]
MKINRFKNHYSLKEKKEILKKIIPEQDAVKLAELLEIFPFQELADISDAIKLFAKGK